MSRPAVAPDSPLQMPVQGPQLEAVDSAAAALPCEREEEDEKASVASRRVKPMHYVITVAPDNETPVRKETRKHGKSIQDSVRKTLKKESLSKQLHPHILGLNSSAQSIRLDGVKFGPGDVLWIGGHGNPTVIGCASGEEDDFGPRQLARAMRDEVKRAVAAIHVCSCNSGLRVTGRKKLVVEHEDGTRETKTVEMPYVFVERFSQWLSHYGLKGIVVYGYIGYCGEQKGNMCVSDTQGGGGKTMRIEESRVAFVDGVQTESPKRVLKLVDQANLSRKLDSPPPPLGDASASATSSASAANDDAADASLDNGPASQRQSASVAELDVTGDGGKETTD